MSAAVKHLTPVTLELGGKCPAVLDSLSSSWDIKVSLALVCYTIIFYSHKIGLHTYAFLVYVMTIC